MYKADKQRKGSLPLYQYWYRRTLNNPNKYNKVIYKLKNFELMLSLAEHLSENIPFVRVDFYNSNGQIYFGEITFFPAAGLGKIEPMEWDYKLGEYIKISN